MSQANILIPAYNAAEFLPTLLKDLSQRLSVTNVLVVNDGSTDGTEAKAREYGAEVVSLGRRSGKGSALAAGFEYLKRKPDVDSVITMDADLQHDPSDLWRFLDARKQGRASIVIGVRRRVGSGMPLERQLSNMLTSWMVSARIGKRIPDSQCGYRLMGMEVLKKMTIESPGYEGETELLIKAARLGFGFSFVPIRTHYGTQGSHMSYWETTRLFMNILLKEY